MNRDRSTLARRYSRMLRQYLDGGEEALLAQAYEIGRRAIATGWGVFDMARAHQTALDDLARRNREDDLSRRSLKAAAAFFLESLSPFEAAHRGFRETNSRLHELIATLEERNQQLAGINQTLEVEISERERTELALRQSEENLRALVQQSGVMQENLRHLSNQILHAQEEERKRISRELHDEVGQALTAISVSLATLKSDGGISASPAMSRKVADTQQLLVRTMESVHRFARELRPSILDELGLLPALRSCLLAFAERTGLQVAFRANPISEQLAGDVKTVLFRVAQESLTNVAKHAKATRVEMSIRRTREGICMEIVDNGRSFREPPADARPGPVTKRLGLLGMQERVRLVNGEFTIRPEPGKGTAVRVMIPFAEGPEEAGEARNGVRRQSTKPPARPEAGTTPSKG